MSKPKKNYKSDPNTSSEKDRCQTPSYALLPIYPHLERLKETTMDKRLVVWEPAAGDHGIVNELEEHGFRVTYGDLLSGQNYFDNAIVPTWYDVQVTNPPYGAQVKYRWIAKAYQRRKPFALLMPFDSWAAKQAQVLFDKYGVEVILPSDRIDFIMPDKGYTKGGSNFASAWFTWGLQIGRMVSYFDITDAKSEYEYQLERRLYAPLQPALFEVSKES